MDSYKQELLEAMRLHAAGEFPAAAAAYAATTAAYPAQLDGWWMRARLALQLGARAEALLALKHALQLNPQHGDTLLLLYEWLVTDPVPAHAVQQIEAMRSAQPDTIALDRVAARLYQHQQQYAAQQAILEALYARGLRSESFYDDYARCLKNNARPEACLRIAEEALARYPDALELLKLRANAQFWLGNHAQALADGEAILARTPEDHYVRTTVGSLKLLLSDCRDGFADYAAHRDFKMLRRNMSVSAALPEWKGEEVAGKNLLVWSSQGIGDVVMFAGFLPWLMARGARVTLAVEAKAVSLLARSFPQITVLPLTDDLLQQPAHAYDAHLSIAQLMQYALPSYPPAEHAPYLQVDAQVVHTLRTRYQAQANGKRLVGIAWHTTNAETSQLRSIALAEWAPLFALPNIQCVSLQYGDHAAEIAAVNAAYPGAVLVDTAVDAFANTEASATQIAAMDAVVSIDNSTVHLAGALGVPTTLLLSATSEWRWGLQGNRSRWYASVAIERQTALHHWAPTFAAVRAQLA